MNLNTALVATQLPLRREEPDGSGRRVFFPNVLRARCCAREGLPDFAARDAARCCAMLRDAARCCAMLRDAARCCAMLRAQGGRTSLEDFANLSEKLHLP